MLLDTLRYLSRGWKFDDVSKIIGVSDDFLINVLIFFTFRREYFCEKRTHVSAEDEDVLHHYSELELARSTGTIT